jgi:hypothetical protein
MTTNRILNLTDDAIALCNTLRAAALEANRLDGKMAYQQHAYGKISDALVETIACAIADSTILHFDEARKIARRLADEAVDNGENISYQIDLWNEGIID